MDNNMYCQMHCNPARAYGKYNGHTPDCNRRTAALAMGAAGLVRAQSGTDHLIEVMGEVQREYPDLFAIVEWRWAMAQTGFQEGQSGSRDWDTGKMQGGYEAGNYYESWIDQRLAQLLKKLFPAPLVQWSKHSKDMALALLYALTLPDGVMWEEIRATVVKDFGRPKSVNPRQMMPLRRRI